MTPLIARECNGRVAWLAHTTRADGDLSPSNVASDELLKRRRALIAHPWRAVRQVHSDRVVDVTHSEPVGDIADALITDESNLVLAVHSADCAPVGFISDGGAVAAAHAGWKGLELGVLEATVRRIRDLTPSGVITAAVGPHIRAAEYEFGAQDLERLRRRFGDTVAGTTYAGQPALDLTAAIASELDRLGVAVETWSANCTAGDGDMYWSYRARREPGRIALTAWIEDAVDD